MDLLGKPVIAATINEFMHFKMVKRDDDLVHFYSEEYPGEAETFSIQDKARVFTYTNHLKYWNACLKSLEDYIDSGEIKGFSARVRTDIPIGAGLSTSAALSVGFIKGLNYLFDLGLDRKEIAEHAYNAEHNILGIMCGRMDQYSIAYGGVTFITTDETPDVEVLEVNCLPLVVGDSCEPREAKKVLNRVKRELDNNNPLYHDAFKRIHNVVLEGREAVLNGCDLRRIGSLMNIQQEQENILSASTAKLNLLCKVAIENGAFGAKQMGAGGGGCMIACCPDEQTCLKVADAINLHGGKAKRYQIFKYKDD
ncbi:MAG: mevalonate kinase family protein [Promethearchaeota archaeon]